MGVFTKKFIGEMAPDFIDGVLKNWANVKVNWSAGKEAISQDDIDSIRELQKTLSKSFPEYNATFRRYTKEASDGILNARTSMKSRGSVSVEPLYNAFQGIKQGMANQGARNFSASMGNINGATPYMANSMQPENLRDFANLPMAIPALGGALGTGAIMAGGAGLGLGLLGNWALRQYGSTLVMKQEADTAQQIARALEASQMNSSRDREPSHNGTNSDVGLSMNNQSIDPMAAMISNQLKGQQYRR